MNRRQFITTALINSLGVSYLGMHTAHAGPISKYSRNTITNTLKDSPSGTSAATQKSQPAQSEQLTETEQLNSAIRDAVSKAKNFEHDYKDDFYLNNRQEIVLRSALHRLTRLQRLVGYANFNLIGFDAAQLYAKRYSSVGRFHKHEIMLIESLYAFDASHYGFFGKKVSSELTDKINQREIKKIAGSGHYVYQGDALKLYQQLKKTMGDELILTSGIRSVVKQLHLFLSKADKSNGNLSRAARSLAPPGHSFHGIGDFDVGQKGLGAANFTNAFTHTNIHKRLSDLGLITERYPESNPYGVRHEPWHIKVVKDV